MNELTYGTSTVLIAGVLLVCMAAAMELGHVIGRRRSASVPEARKEHVNSVLSSIIGILALLLGFTFSLALERYGERSEAVVEEANAIRSAIQKATLLPPDQHASVAPLLDRYLDLRVQEGRLSMVDRSRRDRLLADAADLRQTLWGHARQAIQQAPQDTAPVMFAESVGRIGEVFIQREAELNRHVPELVVLLMQLTFVATGVLVGYAAGLGGHRPSKVSYVMVILIVVLAFLIQDLDRPRRGVIPVSQRSMTDLQTELRAQRIGSVAPAR